MILETQCWAWCTVSALEAILLGWGLGWRQEGAVTPAWPGGQSLGLGGGVEVSREGRMDSSYVLEVKFPQDVLIDEMLEPEERGRRVTPVRRVRKHQDPQHCAWHTGALEALLSLRE